MLIIIEEETQRETAVKAGATKKKPCLPRPLTMSENRLDWFSSVLKLPEEATLRF